MLYIIIENIYVFTHDTLITLLTSSVEVSIYTHTKNYPGANHSSDNRKIREVIQRNISQISPNPDYMLSFNKYLIVG